MAHLLDELRTLLPDTELRLLLALDTDAAFIAAETALERGVHVEALQAPLPADAFPDAEAGRQRRRVAVLSHPRLLPVAPGAMPTVAPVDGPAAGQWNEDAFADPEALIVQHSSLLAAAWDASASPQPDSPAASILQYLHISPVSGEEIALSRPMAGDPGPLADAPWVVWIALDRDVKTTSRSGDTPCYLTAQGDRLVSCGRAVPEALRRRLADLNEFNADYRKLQAADPDLQPDSLLAGIPDELLGANRAGLEAIDRLYGNADALALRFQKRSDGLFGMFGLFAFVLGCLYLIYDKLGEHQGFLRAYLVILLGSLVCYRLLYTKIWFVKHLRYRALAETLRVKFYLHLAGADARFNPVQVLALSGIENFEGFGWIRDILGSLDPLGPARPTACEDPARREFVRRAWVDAQQQYFSRKVSQLDRKSRRVARGQATVVFVTVIVLVTRLLFSDSVRSVYVIADVPLKNVLMLGAGILALLLGAWKLHQSKMATRELIWQYKNQLVHFTRTSRALKHSASPGRCATLLVELGRRSLMECYLWTIHRYHREHSPPAG